MPTILVHAQAIVWADHPDKAHKITHYLVYYYTHDKVYFYAKTKLGCNPMNITNSIYAPATVSITELRRNPGAVIEEAGDSPVAILNHNRATAYLVPADVFEAIMERLEDIDLAELVRKRRSGNSVKVSIDKL